MASARAFLVAAGNGRVLLAGPSSMQLMDAATGTDLWNNTAPANPQLRAGAAAFHARQRRCVPRKELWRRVRARTLDGTTCNGSRWAC
jgi:hypothetical protein